MNLKRLVAAMHAALPLPGDRAHALLTWGSVPEGPGTQYSALTLVQLRLTREVLSDEDLERVLAGSPSDSLLEGAARLLWWIRGWHGARTVRAKRRAKGAHRALEERLTAASPALRARLVPRR